MEIAENWRKRLKGIVILLVLLSITLIVLSMYQRSYIQNRIIRAIDQQCGGEGECIIDLSQLMDFEWDSVTVFTAGASRSSMERIMGGSTMKIDISDGIVFCWKGKAVKIHTSSYYANNDVSPKLSYWVEGDDYRTYSYNDAYLHAKKIKRENGSYRYVLYG